jgi:alpha-glucosidase (family GH31 glycosyl hydrolase)
LYCYAVAWRQGAQAAAAGDNGGAARCSDAENEVWSYGEEVYGICVKYLRARERVRGYIRALMKQAHKKGTPVMTPCFYEFAQDKIAWKVEGQYMFGDRFLVAPVLYPGMRRRGVYLPAGRCGWILRMMQRCLKGERGWRWIVPLRRCLFLRGGEQSAGRSWCRTHTRRSQESQTSLKTGRCSKTSK